MSGKLWVIATPLGNLGDLAPRAEQLLNEVDLIVAEHPDRSNRLIRSKKKWLKLQQPIEARISSQVCHRLQKGEQIALISDAGTPVIADPGHMVVRAALEAGFPVHPIPGPCALSAALSVAGIQVQSALFMGFLPNSAAKRQTVLHTLRYEPHTLVFYESPRRLKRCVEDATAVLGASRRVTLLRELTKLHETIKSTTLEQLANELPDSVKGECVLVVEGHQTIKEMGAQAFELLAELVPRLGKKEAIAIAVKVLGVRKNQCYDWIENNFDA